jgi:hypothetical protein
MLGDNTNSYSIVANELSNGLVSTRYNSADVYTEGGTLNPDTGTMIWIALDLDASPKRAWWRLISYHNSTVNNSGWKNFAGTAGDPTTASSGTDISGLSTPIYAGGTLYFQTTAGNIVLNMGGWPLLTDWVPYPSGYSSPDANYPYTMPSGVYTLSTTEPATVTISQNNMRATITANFGGGVNALNYSAVLPSSKKKIWAWVCDAVHQHNLYFSTGLTDDLNAVNMVEWRSSGATADFGGITLPAYGSGSVCYWAVDSGAQLAWVSVDGSSWFGASGSSGDPFAGTNGIDLSGLVTMSTTRPALLLNSDRYVAGTFNAGKIVDSAITLSNGWEWLETPVVGKARAFIIG